MRDRTQWSRDEHGGWSTSVDVPSWADLGPDGRVEIAIGEASEPTAEHDRALDWLMVNAPAVRAATLGALFAVYPEWQNDYGYDDDERAELMPDMATPGDLPPLLSETVVQLHGLWHRERPYIGVGGNCRWDDEHGYGVMLHGTRVIETGGWDTSYLTWIAERDAEDG